LFIKAAAVADIRWVKYTMSYKYWEQLEGIKKLLCRLNRNTTKELLIPAIIYIP
jgi:hypothetical protein